MLSDEEIDRVGDEGAGAMEALEVALLAAIASVMLSLGVLDVISVNRARVSLLAKINSIIARHKHAVSAAVERDLAGATTLHAVTEAERLVGTSWAAKAAAKAVNVSSAVRALQSEMKDMQRAMASSGKGAYSRAIEQAKRDSARVGFDEAVRRAVVSMAREGLTAYTYKRRTNWGMTTVHVPVDVGVRRAIRTAGLSAMMRQDINLAEEHGFDLVEVNTTCNARVSHAAWQGKVYSLSGDNPRYEKYSTACRVGDLVNGIGGYNCGHRIAVTTEGAPSVFGDPLEGTGYTQAEARAAVAKQRKIENEIRKAKREMEVLKLNGLDAADVNKRIRRHQGALREHIKANSQILHRQPARESIYNKAREKVGELGKVHLDAAQEKRIIDSLPNSVGADRANPFEHEKPPLIATNRQLGRKMGKHAAEFGLDPSRSEDRTALCGIIDKIVNDADEVVRGDWRGQGSKCYFYIKGRDVVVADGEHNFVTVLKGGTNNERIKRARNKNGERS